MIGIEGKKIYSQVREWKWIIREEKFKHLLFLFWLNSYIQFAVGRRDSSQTRIAQALEFYHSLITNEFHLWRVYILFDL